MISAVNNQRGDHGCDDQPAVRQFALLNDLLHDRQLSFATARDLQLETLDALDRIQPQIVRIGPDKAHGVGPARQRLKPVFFKRFKVIFADLQGP